MKYRKKPVVIDAVQVSELIHHSQSEWNAMPEWVREGYEDGKLLFAPDTLYVETDEGQMKAHKEDWLIRGVKGELYPCKPDIFALTYEEVNE